MSRYAARTQQGAIGNWGKSSTFGFVDSYGIASNASTAITVSNKPYRLITFTSDGTLTVTTAGLFDFIIIGGGSSGETSWNGNGRPGSGGGGSGGYLETTLYLPATTYSVVIGVGGANPATQIAYNFGTASTVTPSGGQAILVNGSASGKGAAPAWSSSNAAPYPLQGGTNGGSGNSTSGGGGGGLGSAGSAAAGSTGGAGGSGKDISLWLGQSAGTTLVGGGGGGASNTQGFGVGGSGGGGGAAPGTGVANAAANTGGGGRAGSDTDAGNGGSGVVYVRYRT
jgi:hypothetical protein